MPSDLSVPEWVLEEARLLAKAKAAAPPIGATIRVKLPTSLAGLLPMPPTAEQIRKFYATKIDFRGTD